MESLNVRVRKFPVDGTNGYIVETHNQFMFHLVRFFVEGNYAHEKLLHWNRIKHTNEEFVKGLIVGHFQGDGDHHPENHNSGRKLKLVSVSDRLLYQMRTLLAGTGHLTRIGHCKGKPGHIEHDGVEGKQIDEILKIRPGGLLKKQSRVKLFSNGFFGNVNFSDVTEDYDISSVKVCNFEVDEDHTYVVDSLVVHNCDFLASGETFLSDGDIRWVGSLAKPPAQRMGPDNNVWVWKGPLSHQKYLISADVSRGDATDFSAFHVICYSGEVVAEYKGKIRPDRFAELLIQLGTMYNTALICPESNTYGYAVCMKIQESGYPKLYYQGDRNVYIGDFVPKQDLSKAGFATTGGNRHRILSKLEEVIRNKKLISYSSRFYDELKTFVWLGEKAQAMRNRNDDLLLSMAIGSWILDAAEGYNQDSSLIAEAMLASMGTSRTEFKQPEIRGAGSATYPVPGTNTDPAVDVFQDGKASDRSRFRYGVQVTGPFKWLLD
jgi:hypothetical protein